jgi:hypothetical protein
VIDAKGVEHGGVEVIDVDGVLHDVVGVVVGLAVVEPGFESASGDPGGEAASVVVAPVVFRGEFSLAVDGAAELTAEDDDGVV